MMPKPGTKLAKLTEQVNSLGESGNWDKLTLARLRREVQSALPEFPADAHALLGFLSAMEGDEGEMRKSYAIALKLDARSSRLTANFASALRNMSFYSEARRVARSALDLDPSDLVLFDKLVDCTASASRYQEANSMLQHRGKLKPSVAHPRAANIKELSAFYSRYSIQDEDGEKMLELAVQTMHNAAVHRSAAFFEVLEDEETEWFSAEIEIAGSVEEIVSLNETLCDRIAGTEFPDEAMVRLVFMFVPESSRGDHAS